jgi:peptidoglycan/xylan/chitin deacetylase (PgdA/CDA1 family)
MPDIGPRVRRDGGRVVLPFDPGRAIENLQFERYVGPADSGRWLETSWARSMYYRLRPFLPLALRKHLQQMYLRGWEKMTFPRWPVDRSVDLLFERLLAVALDASGLDHIPFIWFWPDGYRAAAIVTHDVETAAGRDFCPRLMDVDERYGIRSAFQIVPEVRYDVPAAFLATIRERGCEVNIHGLDHIGNLFGDRGRFMEAARKINEYGRLFGAQGFRSPALYRNADWFRELDFSYDMSVPNVARLEAQRGGCCTVMPYFLPGGVLELPLTTAEDYTLFHILNDYSTDLWDRQIDTILGGHGLVSLLAHPDYLGTERAMGVYEAVLERVARLGQSGRVWVSQPGEIDRWWRARNSMALTPRGSTWAIDGPESERARVAYAVRDGDSLAYEIEA